MSQIFTDSNALAIGLPKLKPFAYPSMRKVLMVTPDFYDVKYAINPHMLDSNGNLNRVDKAKANLQWETLKRTYESLGLKVEIIKGAAGLPDMVFTANQSFVWWDEQKQKPQVLLSRMNAKERSLEVSYFRDWYHAHGYDVYILESNASFEGNGDALLYPSRGVVIGAVGPRTNKEAYVEIANRFSLPIVQLELIKKDFYHLDTCFSILDSTTVAFLPSAFSKESLEMIDKLFQRKIVVREEEASKFFACNCHSIQGRFILLHPGSQHFVTELENTGYEVMEVDTSEFIKAGGSVFCMKMVVF